MNTLKQILITLLLLGILGFGFILWAESKVNQITATVESKIDETVEQVTAMPGELLAPVEDFVDRETEFWAREVETFFGSLSDAWELTTGTGDYAPE